MFRRLLSLALFAAILATLPAHGASAAEPSTPLIYGLKGAVMLLDGQSGQPRKIGQGRQPSLAPDGLRAVWVEHGEDAAKASIAVYDTATGKQSLLAKPGGYLQTPRFSPDGRSVAFTRMGEDGRQSLWLVRSGENPVQLPTTGDGSLFELAWTPDGAFITAQDMRWLRFFKPDGSEARRVALSDVTGGKQDAVTSADRFSLRPGGSGEILYSMMVPGTKLFHKKVPDLSSALFLYDPKSGKTTRLTPENLTAFAPSWTPDGQGLLFTGYTDVQAGSAYPFRVWSMRLGDSPREVTPGEDPAPPSGP
ncbi:PD40 domain-containing protein [Fundidesulfovibrio putealis]|uniref:PD40 domain-containing protein n=1 Tax=Fundidesulfovibrio putealis TaxID=270496 RepID=UPI00041250AE|nr:PD40 domain-containing protein [Fundidesulfovibrio putealis]